MSARVRPYLVADPETVGLSGWEVEVGELWEPLSATVPEWDYNTDLRLRTTFAANREALRRSTGLAAEAPLHLTVSWRSLDGRIGHSAARFPLDRSLPSPLYVTLPGDHLGPEIDLATRIVLAEDTPTSSPGVAHLAGSVLWEHVTNVLLVGEGGRFPVMVVDFAASGLDADASWVLDLPEDLDSPVQGSLVLLINSNDADLLAAASGRRKGADRMLEDLHEQVAIQLLDHAVLNADELESETWGDGSLGATLAILMTRCDDGLLALASLRTHRPSAYRARLVGEARRNGFGRTIR